MRKVIDYVKENKKIIIVVILIVILIGAVYIIDKSKKSSSDVNSVFETADNIMTRSDILNAVSTALDIDKKIIAIYSMTV